MGNYVSSSQISPQLLGISFIENYKFYFGHKVDNPNTSDVSDIVKDAFQKQKILTETMHLINNAEKLNKSEVIKKLRNILGESSPNLNTSRLVYDLANAKKDHQEFIDIIKGLKHDKRILEHNLENIQKEYNELNIYVSDIRSTIGILHKENTNLRKEKFLDHLRIGQLSTELSNKEQEIVALQSNINSKTEEINKLSIKLYNKEQEIAALQSDINSKTEEINQLSTKLSNKEQEIAILQSDINSKTEEIKKYIDNLDNALGELEEKETIEVVDQVSDMEEALNLLIISFQERISQLEAENEQLRQNC